MLNRTEEDDEPETEEWSSVLLRLEEAEDGEEVNADGEAAALDLTGEKRDSRRHEAPGCLCWPSCGLDWALRGICRRTGASVVPVPQND
jgi:hypothetical protein